MSHYHVTYHVTYKSHDSVRQGLSAIKKRQLYSIKYIFRQKVILAFMDSFPL